MHAEDFGIYVHIPFCERKCIYCDFLSFGINTIGNESVEKYFDTLYLEMNKRKKVSIKLLPAYSLGEALLPLLNRN